MPNLYAVYVGTERPNTIDLEKFVSVYAEPGRKVVFSGANWKTVYPDQATRRRNWRILMEACLKANGGTGEHSGNGWYSTAQTAGKQVKGGVVLIHAPLQHEPYADGQYAPFFDTATSVQYGFSTEGWTFPAGITIQGISRQPGEGTWSNSVPGGAKLVGWGSPAARWYGLAGPDPSPGTSRHTSHWALKNITLTTNSATPAGAPYLVFHTAHARSPGSTIGTSEWWTIDDVVIDLQNGSGVAPQVGALIQGGFGCKIPRLQIMGHGNPDSWGLVQSGLFDSGTWITNTTTVHFGDLTVHGTSWGAIFTGAACLIDTLTLENTASYTTVKQQLIIGSRCKVMQVGLIWAENNRKPDATKTWGADDATIVIGGDDTEWNMAPTAYEGPYIASVGAVYSGTYADPTPANRTQALIKLRCASAAQIGPLVAASYPGAGLHIAPTALGYSVATSITRCVGEYNSAFITTDSGVPAVLDSTNYTADGNAHYSRVVDRAMLAAGMAPAKPNRGNFKLNHKIIQNPAPAGEHTEWVVTTAGADAAAVLKEASVIEAA